MRRREVLDSVDALARETARSLDADLATVRALLDVRTWRAFERQGLQPSGSARPWRT